MKYKYTSFFYVFLIILCFTHQLYGQASKTYTAIKIPAFWNVPEIDGTLSEKIWNYANVDSLLFGGEPNSFGVRWNNFSDNLVIWQAAWDSLTNKLYVAVTINDDIRGIFDNSNPNLNSFQPFKDECLEFFVDGDNSGGEYEGSYDQAQQWLVTGENKVVLDSYPQANGYNIYSGYDLVTAVSWGSPGNWNWEAEFRIYNTMPVLRKTLAKGDTIGWNIWYDDSDNETFIVTDSTYDRDHQVGWLYSGKAYNDANFFGDIILGDVPNLPPEKPSLIEPNHNAFINSANPTLIWNIPKDLNGDSLHFKVEIATDSSFTNHISGSPFESYINTSGFNPAPPLLEGKDTCRFTLQNNLADGEYWWRVTAWDGFVFGDSSTSRKFMIDTYKPLHIQIHPLNPTFGTNWYNQKTNPSIKIVVQYEETHAQTCSLKVLDLNLFYIKENIPSGKDSISFDKVDISHFKDGSLFLIAKIIDKAGNADADTAHIILDATAPERTTAQSPEVSSDAQFTVSWKDGSDKNGSGLSGFYDINVKIDNEDWKQWKTRFSDTSDVYIGAHGHTYSFEAMAWDNVGNREDSTGLAECITRVFIDTLAPSAPNNIRANGSNPSPWRQSNKFEITWENPPDSSGIDRCFYKLGIAPTSNYDTTGTSPALPPIIVEATKESGQDLHLWLQDGKGNVNYVNHSSVNLRYDITPPTGTIANSPDTSTMISFTVSWSGANDDSGSGLSGLYDVKVKKDDGIWVNWKTRFYGTNDIYTGENGSTYSFEALAWDSVDNREDSTEIAESKTTIFVDIQAPPAPINPLANGANPSPWQRDSMFVITWKNPPDPSGIYRCFYKLGSKPTYDSDITNKVIALTEILTLEATQEFGQMLYLWLEDSSGNVNHQNCDSILLRYDATPPVVEITSPKYGEKIREIVNIRTSISDINIKGYKLEYKLKSHNQWKYLFEDSLDLSIEDSLIFRWENSIDSGNVYLRLTAWDILGNSKSNTVLFSLDNLFHEKLIAQILYPTNNSILNDSVNIIGSARGDHFKNYTLSLRGQNIDTVLTDSTVQKEYETLYLINTNLFPDGAYTLSLTTFNIRGYQKTDSVQIEIDNRPGITYAAISNPLNNEYLSDSEAIVGIATGDDFVKYSIFLIGQNINTLLGDSTTKIINDTLLIFDTNSFQDGHYTLYLTVFNNRGFQNVDEISVIFDNTPPRVEITSPRLDTISCFVEINGIKNDKNFKSMNLKYADALETDPLKFHPIDTCFTYWNTMELNGFYNIYLTVEDLGGLTTIDQKTYYIDNPRYNPRKGIRKVNEEFSLYIPPSKDTTLQVICLEKRNINDFDYNSNEITPTGLIVDIHSNTDDSTFVKPCVLSINYGDLNSINFDENILAVFNYENGVWQFIGGTSDKNQSTISTTIRQIGIYGLFKNHIIPPGDNKDLQLVNCQPRIFSPLGGGHNTQTAISFDLSNESNITIKIYNAAGRLVRVLKENEKMPQGNNVVYWDGKDQKGEFCVSGLYIVTIQAGEKMATKTVVVLNK